MSKSDRNDGFTLIEVALVIGLLAIMSTLVASRFGVIDSYRQKNAIRHFIGTWEMLHQQARARGESLPATASTTTAVPAR